MLTQAPLTININNNYTINCFGKQSNGLTPNLKSKKKASPSVFESKQNLESKIEKNEEFDDSNPLQISNRNSEEKVSSEIKRRNKGLVVKIPAPNAFSKGITQSANTKNFSIETELFLNERKRSLEMKEKLEKAKYYNETVKAEILKQHEYSQKLENLKKDSCYPGTSPKAIQEKGAFIDRFREKILGGVLILFSFLFFIFFTVCVCLGLDMLGTMIPLSLIVGVVLTYVNWVSMKIFRHS
jgi:hypothetical protein